MFDKIFSATIYGICALIMVGVGVSDLIKKTPCGFYSGDDDPTEDEITDVRAWNKKHGIMWIIYGVIIMVGWVIGSFMGETPLVLIPSICCVVIPIPFINKYHKKLVREYRIKTE